MRGVRPAPIQPYGHVRHVGRWLDSPLLQYAILALCQAIWRIRWITTHSVTAHARSSPVPGRALLFSTRLVPCWPAAWGFIGYARFAGGNLLELFGTTGLPTLWRLDGLGEVCASVDVIAPS